MCYNLLRKILLSAGILLMCSGNVSAQEVTVIGMGYDRDGAIRDAARNAVEQVAGTYIDSRTLMENLAIQLDEVYKNSQGFVRSIKVIDEEAVDAATYRVRAKVDVDTNPNSAFVDKLTMLMQLNDPRIMVIVYDAADESARNDRAEDYMLSELFGLGFRHLIDSYKFFDNDTNLNIDYLVRGQCKNINRTVQIPNYGESAMADTPFTNYKAVLKVDVIKYATNEVIGTFTTEGSAIESDKQIAEMNAVNIAAAQAAEQLANTFKRLSAETTQGLSFTITASDDSKLDKIINDLRSIGKIDNLHIREISDNTAILTVDSSQKPYEIVSILKNRTKLGVFVENITDSSCKLRIT